MERLHFLQNIWQPYPAAPLGWSFGRLHQLETNHLSLIRFKLVETYPVSGSTCLKGRAQNLVWPDLIQVLRPGDWVAVRNQEIILLAPALKVPRKSEVVPELLEQWTAFLVRVRQFFLQHSFHEVSTPTVVTCPGTEPYLDPVSAGLGKYLPTSPELHLKKALSMGLGPLFEIRPCFRQGEISERHQPEFWMLEWYRPMADLEVIKQDVRELVSFVGGGNLSFENQSLAELFRRDLNFNLTPQTSRPELLQLGKSLDLKINDQDSWDDIFNFIFVDRLEKDLGVSGPLFLENYPPEMAALARLTPEGWGDRFEFYWKGFEIANAFHELNDPHEQLLRSSQDNAKKTKIGKKPVETDPDFFDALFEGMPPSAGIALGLERLFMCLTNSRNFSDFRIFSES